MQTFFSSLLTDNSVNNKEVLNERSSLLFEGSRVVLAHASSSEGRRLKDEQTHHPGWSGWDPAVHQKDGPQQWTAKWTPQAVENPLKKKKEVADIESPITVLKRQYRRDWQSRGVCVFMIGVRKVCRQIYLWTVENLFYLQCWKSASIFGNKLEKERASKRKDLVGFLFLSAFFQLTGGFLEAV